MIGKVLTKVFGSQNDRVLKQIKPLVNRINELEDTVSSLDDAQLAARTVEFRERVAKGEDLDKLLPEAFATMREAGKLLDIEVLDHVIVTKDSYYSCCQGT